MARYEYECGMCREIYERRRPMAESDLPDLCSCGGVARRVLSVPGGLGGKAKAPLASDQAPMVIRRPGPIATNCSFNNCQTAIRMDGGHINFDGLAITKCPTAFELNHGATVDLRNTRYEP